jgi:multidrug efflux pump subunit AcrB
VSGPDPAPEPLPSLPGDADRSFTDTCIRRPVVAWMLMLATLIFGVIGYLRIGISELPDVDIPYVTIQVAWEGAAPEMIEHDVVEPIEESLAQVQGLKSLTSTARNGSATIQMEMAVSRDIDLAIQDVQNKLGQVQYLLPADVEPPVVMKANFEDFPIMWISLSGPFSQAELADVARYTVRPKLQTVPGVGEIQWGGYLERNVRIWFDRERLDERGLTAGECVAALRRAHQELPAGRIETASREMDVRVYGEALRLAELAAIPVGGTAAQPVRLRDVALVEDGFEDQRAIGRNSGRPAQALGVKKQIGENTVAVAAAARQAIETIRPTLPAGMSLEINYDGARFIAQSVHEVQFELLLSVALTSLVCWLFLGSFRAAFNVVLAIPMSVMGTVAVLYFCGFTLNTFTLLALALAIGVVVDDAIMVQENISRHAERGLEARRAASFGTREIRFAALAATVAIVAIFLPVVFMPGIIGKFFLQFGVALSVAVILSYLEAVTLAPARCAQFMRVGRSERGWLGRHADAVFARLARTYRRMLPATLRHPWLTLAAAVLVFAGAIAVLASPLLRKEATPQVDDGVLFVRYETQAGASLEETDRLMRRVEDWLLARSEVQRFFTIVGGFGGTGTNTAVMFVTLTPAGSGRIGKFAFKEVVTDELNRIPGLKTVVQEDPGPGSRGYTIEYSLRGNDWGQVVRGAEELTRRMEAARTEPSGSERLFARLGLGALPEPKPLFIDIDTDYQLGRPEIAVRPDRDRCHDLGVPIADVAQTMNLLVGGAKVGKFSQGSRRVDIRARLLAADRLTPDDLGTYRVRTASGQLVPLSELVTVAERPVLQQISRKDHARAIAVFANMAPGLGQKDGLDRMPELSRDLGPGLALAEEGASAYFREVMESFAIAFVLGILFAWMILAAQFNSILHPFTVLSILPLAIAGAAFSLALGGFSLNIFSFIGILLLMGLVKKNSIILVDYAERGRLAGLSPGWAILRAGSVRLRPILMTSAATAAAAVPVVLGLGAGTELRQPMAVAVLGGVILSTVLSLVVVPACYVILERLRERVFAWFRSRRQAPR